MAMVTGRDIRIASPAGKASAAQSNGGNIYIRSHWRVRSWSSDITKDMRLSPLSISGGRGIERQGSLRLDARLALYIHVVK